MGFNKKKALVCDFCLIRNKDSINKKKAKLPFTTLGSKSASIDNGWKTIKRVTRLEVKFEK